MPFLALQSSVSVWNEPSTDLSIDIKIGSFLIAVAYAVAALFALSAPRVLRIVSPGVLIVICYGNYFFF